MKSNAAPPMNTIYLSSLSPDARRDFIQRYAEEVYLPAFPDPEIREDTDYWLELLETNPLPPQPRIEVVLLTDDEGAIAGGVTIELYRAANAGLLTYISVAPHRRGQGVGKRLVQEARKVLNGFGSADTLMFAETERLEDAKNPDELAATELRQKQLTGLGARWVEFDYVMPPLRADTLPHNLHLMVFDGPDNISSNTVVLLLEELAEALGTRLSDHGETSAMAAKLRSIDQLPVKSLPAVARG